METELQSCHTRLGLPPQMQVCPHHESGSALTSPDK
jgi:hypothetical protein